MHFLFHNNTGLITPISVVFLLADLIIYVIYAKCNISCVLLGQCVAMVIMRGPHNN